MNKCEKCGSKKQLTKSFQRSVYVCEPCRSKPNKSGRGLKPYKAPKTIKWEEYANKKNSALAKKYKSSIYG